MQKTISKNRAVHRPDETVPSHQAKLTGSSRDQTYAEMALRSNHLDTAAFLDAMAELVVFQDRDMRVLWANRAAGRSIDLRPDQLRGRFCYEIWHQRTCPCGGCPVVMVRSSGEPREAEITTPDGRVWHIHGYPVRSEQGEIIGILEVTLEVTAKKRAEQALRESEGRFRSLFETTHEAIGASGPDGRIITANPAMARVLGLKTPKDLIGIPAVDLYADPKDREDFFRRLRAKGFVENFELTLMKQDGSRQPIYILGNATLHTDERDQLQRIDFIFSNITDR